MSVHILNGDCVKILPHLPENSIDAVVTDPPYGLSKEPNAAEVLGHWLAGDDYERTGGGFMGKTWDSFVPGPSVWREIFRVLKPGGHLLAFGGTRTYDLLCISLRLAGFEIRDSVHWLYGSGFPKSLDVSKAIDKAAGAEREVMGQRSTHHERPITDKWDRSKNITEPGNPFGDNPLVVDVTAPATDAARQWSGWGTALKPAHEPIVVARKPLAGTVAGNVLAYGTGALNIDGCRVAMGDEYDPTKMQRQQHSDGAIEGAFGAASLVGKEIPTYKPGGRWPANLVFTHAADCEQVGTHDVKSSGFYPAQRGEGQATGFGKGKPDPNGPRPSGNGDGTETVAVWRCVAGCPVAELDGQSGLSGGGERRKARPGKAKPFDDGKGWNAHGMTRDGATAPESYGDTGGASRFFTVTEWDPTADVPPFRYVAKPSKKERNAGLDGLPEKREADRTKDDGAGGDNPRNRTNTAKVNHHPTVKPVALMRWLVRLVTPPGGTVLDPFAGSGTTLVAAVLEGFDAIGIEMTDDYLPIIKGRVAWAEEQAADTAPTLFDDAGQGQQPA